MEVRTSIIRIITVLTSSHFISTCHTAPLSFHLTNCDNSTKLFGTAACGDSGIELTSSDYYTTGQAHYSKPIRLWDASTGNLTSFNTTFTFSMDNNNGNYSFDGLAFFIASFNYTSPGPGGAAGLLGLVDSKNLFNSKGINPFVAVEFDTNYNSDWDTLSDVHVGIDVNSIKSVASKRWRSYSDGTTMSASVSYKAKNLCVEFTGGLTTDVSQEQTEVKVMDVPGDTLCYEIDMKNYLTEWAVFGFSASTSYMYQSHTLKTWSFSSDLELQVNRSNHTTQTGKDEGGKTNKNLIIGLSVGISGGLAILILVGTVIRARSNKRLGPNLQYDSGRRTPDGFLTARKDRSSVVKVTR
ncbi:unnamed protein product [Linum grandiflorum]